MTKKSLSNISEENGANSESEFENEGSSSDSKDVVLHDPFKIAKYHWDRATEETNHARNRVNWAAVLQLALLAFLFGGDSSPSTDIVIKACWFGVILNLAATIGFGAAVGASSNLMRKHDKAMELYDNSRSESERQAVPIATRGFGGGWLPWHVIGLGSSVLIVMAYFVIWIAGLYRMWP